MLIPHIVCLRKPFLMPKCAYFENLKRERYLKLNFFVTLGSRLRRFFAIQRSSLYNYKAFRENTNLQLVEDAPNAMDTWSLTQNFAVCVARIQSSLCFSIYEVFLKRCACIRCSRNNSPYPHIFALLLTR